MTLKLPTGSPTTPWHKSSYSGGGGNDCIEHASFTDGTQGVRDSKDLSIAPFFVSAGSWQSFVNYAKGQQI